MNDKPNVPYIGAAKKDCPHLEFCSEMGVATKVCKVEGNTHIRCNQGDYAQIKLLASILKTLSPKNEPHNTSESSS